jgi:hypothetical protein
MFNKDWSIRIPTLKSPLNSNKNMEVVRVEAGTLLTLASQILTYSPNGIDQQQNMEVVATINTLLSTSVLKVRGAPINSNYQYGVALISYLRQVS